MALTKGGGAVSPPKIQDSGKNNKIELNSTSDQIEFTTNDVLRSILDTSGNFLLGLSSATSEGIELERSSASSDFGLKIKNTANGDAKITLATAANQFSVGIDNSDSDKFKISSSLTDVGASTLFTLDSSGNITLTGILDLGTNPLQNLVDPTNAQDAATKNYVDTVASAQNELSEMDDVTFTSLATGQMMYSTDGSNWANASNLFWDETNDRLGINQDTPGADLHIGDAATNSNTVLRIEGSSLSTINFADAADSNVGVIQYNHTANTMLFNTNDVLRLTLDSTGLNFNSHKGIDLLDPTNAQDAATKNYVDTTTQPVDSDLTALAGLTTTGIIVRTGAGTATTRQLVENTTNAITITDGDGVSGNPQINIQAGLDSIAGLTTAADRMIYTTALNTYNTADFTSFARQLLDDADASTARSTLELNAGEAGDIWVEKAGDTMTGLLTLSGDPTASLHATTKQYVDSLAAGLDPKGSCVAATTANLSGYSAVGGTSGTGGFTNIDTTTIDGHTMASSDRVLVLNQTDAKQNGIYVITTLNATTGAMERSTDHDGTPSNEVSGGNTTFVENGTTYSGRTYALQGDGDLALNTDNLDWQLLSNATDWTWGTGLANSGNTVNAVLETTGIAGSVGTLSFNGDNIAVDLGFTATTALRGDAQIGQLSNVNTSGVSNGNTLYYDAGTWRAASQVFWDETNDRLGISESAPETKLHINGGTGNLEVLIESTDAESGLQLRDNTGSTNLMTVGDSFQVRPAGTNAIEVDGTGLIISSNRSLFIQDGSAASPSFRFVSDDDTGIFRVAANTLGISAAGTNQLQIQSGIVRSFANIESVDGSAASPSIRFTSDPDTGIYSDGSGGFAISVGGSPSLILNSNAQLIIGNGTAALPKYSFFNDQDTGIYLAATGELGFSTAGTQRVEIKAAGLELLTGQLLNLDGVAGAPTYSFTSDTNSGIFSPAADTIGFSTNGVERVRVTTSTLDLTDLQIHAGGGTAAAPIYSFDTDTDTGIYRSAIDSLSIATAGTQRIVVNASGDVGIGESGPDYRLEIADTTELLLSLKRVGVGEWQFGVDSSNSLVFSDAGTSHVVIDTLGNMGVGTTSPVGLLNVEASSGNSQVFITVNDTTSRSQLIFGDSADSNVGSIQYNHTDDSLQLHTGNLGEQLRIDSTGDVGIGQTNPQAKVHIGDAASDSNTVLRIEGSSFSTINFADAADSNVGIIQYNHTDNSMAFNTNDAERLSIESDGEIIVTNKVTLGTDGSLDHGTASTSATTQVSIFEFPLATYMGAKVIVCVEDTTATESTISELLITHDGVTAVSTQYATVSTDTDRATFDVDINTGNVRLLATPASTNNMTFKVMSTQLLA